MHRLDAMLLGFESTVDTFASTTPTQMEVPVAFSPFDCGLRFFASRVFVCLPKSQVESVKFHLIGTKRNCQTSKHKFRHFLAIKLRNPITAMKIGLFKD